MLPSIKTATLRILNRELFKIKNQYHTTKAMWLFWERDDKGGYRDDRKLPSKLHMIREGLKELKGEIKLWSAEVKERFEMDPLLTFRPEETDVVWKFGSNESLMNWVVTSDKDNNEGRSTCSLTLNKHGKGLFSGNLEARVPKDGRLKRTGYCNIKTLRARKSFKRDAYVDWGFYNMLVIKIRGDGRSYMLNIHTKGYFDITWNDMYNYVLYTRGGPYWQIAKIPFSKFFFSSKGRIQDKQCPLPLSTITNFSITVGDKINGPFNLEIDYIGVEYDPSHTEECAYEAYKTQQYIVGV